MTEQSGRDREISRREREMYRVEAIRDEMSSAVRFLGGEGSAKEAITKAAQAAKLSHTTIERLRWKKIKRVPADIADKIREAVARHQEEGLRRARHELLIAQQTNAALIAHLEAVDPAFHSATIDALRRQASDLRGDHDL